MLNAVEVKVLMIVRKAIQEENGEFCFSNQVKIAGMNVHEIGGYLSQLYQKGYIYVSKIDENDRHSIIEISQKAQEEYFPGAYVNSLYITKKDSAEAESSSLVLPDTCDNVIGENTDDLSRSLK